MFALVVTMAMGAEAQRFVTKTGTETLNAATIKSKADAGRLLVAIQNHTIQDLNYYINSQGKASTAFDAENGSMVWEVVPFGGGYLLKNMSGQYIKEAVRPVTFTENQAEALAFMPTDAEANVSNILNGYNSSMAVRWKLANNTSTNMNTNGMNEGTTVQFNTGAGNWTCLFTYEVKEKITVTTNCYDQNNNLIKTIESTPHEEGTSWDVRRFVPCVLTSTDGTTPRIYTGWETAQNYVVSATDNVVNAYYETFEPSFTKVETNYVWEADSTIGPDKTYEEFTVLGRNYYKGSFDLYDDTRVANDERTYQYVPSVEVFEYNYADYASEYPEGSSSRYAVLKGMEYGEHQVTIDYVYREGKSYPVTEVAGNVRPLRYVNAEPYTSITMNNLVKIGGGAFGNSGAGSADNYSIVYKSLVAFEFPKLEHLENSSFYNQSNYVEMYPRLVSFNAPSVKSMGNNVLYSGPVKNTSCYNRVRSLSFPNLENLAICCIAGNSEKRSDWKSLELLELPRTVQMKYNNFNGIEGTPTVVLLGEGDFKVAGGGNFYNTTARIVVPMGEAGALAASWKIPEVTKRNDVDQITRAVEIYAPVSIKKSNSNYNSLTIEPNSEIASCTMGENTFVNYYDFNYALTKEEVMKPITYKNTFSADSYNHRRLVATDYADVDSEKGLLTIASPSGMNMPVAGTTPLKGVAPGEGFLLYGPAFSGTGDDVIYVPVHPYYYSGKPQQATHVFSGNNYMKAGTGAAVAKESDGNRNFYYSDPNGFFECRGTVIPTNRSYLALPSSMTANIKKLSFVINDDNFAVTAIDNIEAANTASEAWYTLSGVKLSAKPTEKGIYIHNGKKEIIK